MELWQQYTEGKQTYQQLAQEYGVSGRTIQRRLDLVTIKPFYKQVRESVVLMDTTYFGRYGVMVFKNTDGIHLYWKYVKYETIAAYVEGINHLEEKGIQIKGIVCDGRRGLFKALEKYPIQMCQFHQAAIVRRYLTKRPRFQAAIELKEITLLMSKTDKESFFGILDQWHEHWKDHINERAINAQTGKSRYVHKRLRSAYKSLERNKQYLFTWYDNMNLGIPNTNNQLEGTFTDLKNKLRNHNGLSRRRKEKIINDYLSKKE
ncbi:MAG: transposase [Bacteroidales bacterium]|nr:transposase [Bacteroidales bacterium]